jgi:hypothetical protein
MRLAAHSIAAACLFACTATATEHIIEHAIPRGAGRGETVEVRLYGKYLDDPQEVVFHSPGIRCISIAQPIAEKEPVKFVFGGHVVESVTARFEVAKDCPIGEHLLRLRTRKFLSEPVTFWVGPFPTVEEEEAKQGVNNTPAKAQLVPANSTVNGRILPGDDMDRDCYCVDLKKGQRLSAVLEAVRLGTQHWFWENDCRIRIVGPRGDTLAVVDDTPLLVQDPLAGIIADADGRYTVEVAQQLHTPGPQCLYRLHLGTCAIPTAVFPAGGPPGETIAVQCLGDAGGAFTKQVTLPQRSGAVGELDFLRWQPDDDGVASPLPLALRVTSHRNIVEPVDHDVAVPAAPVAFNGILARDGERDEWRFHADKGARLDIRVYGRTLGGPIDPRISIRRIDSPPDSKPLVVADDATLPERGYWACHKTLTRKDLLDPAVLFVAPEAGDYVVGIADTRGLGGPQHVYRIEVSSHVDGLHPILLGLFGIGKKPREVAIVVPRGNRWTTNVTLVEGLASKFTGDAELQAVGLPRGVTMQAGRFTPQLRNIPVQFTADATAEPGVAFIQLVARAVDGTPLVGTPQQGFVFTNRRSGLGWCYAAVDHFALAVVEASPMRVECESSAVSIARNGEAMIDLRIVREPGFEAEVELQADWLPPGIEKGLPVSVAAGETAAQLRLRATDKALVGTWPITVTASTLDGDVNAGTGCRLVTTPFIQLDISEPYLSLKFERAAIERGQSGEITAAVVHNKPFSGKAVATLTGLPYGVRQIEPFPAITSSDTSCAFQVEVTTDTLVGPYKDISAEVAVPVDGRAIRQQSGGGILRVDPTRGTK